MRDSQRRSAGRVRGIADGSSRGGQARCDGDGRGLTAVLGWIVCAHAVVLQPEEQARLAGVVEAKEEDLRVLVRQPERAEQLPYPREQAPHRRLSWVRRVGGAGMGAGEAPGVLLGGGMPRWLRRERLLCNVFPR